ncbi:2-keto-4-pentenoate hydratase/2-oxohepta-3-ene-1,7-dioic acid hydratase in catechol pathway [Constrictibacter sp. MBR-5]|jgi:2-keto-4-pentenoate hydratase/2-oxohepta-3-ene-1,7-dioic acid hydratase in catechol pathway|uniref:fumarylacetoacetate hydrolase family protein n=1 Tax=Constrictibacter sp. MBR-5 TaxID=3156467 RepID=UPI0033973BE5
MKLLRYGPAGAEKPGMLDSAGTIRDLSAIIADLTPAAIGSDGLDRLREIDPATLPKVDGAPRMGVPLAGIGKIVAIGLNYSDHAAETGNPIPKEPIVFMKATSSLTGPSGPVVIPKKSQKLDWEVELGVVIGRTTQYVTEADALSYVAGYVLANDISEREWQIERGGQWTKGKSGDTFCPLGPWLVTADEVKDPQKLSLFLDVNGERRQTGTTDKMIFGVAHIISYLSQMMTLQPGDVIVTGTPPGVGAGHKPPIFLKPGDEMHLGIEGLGEQRCPVVAWEDRPR